MTITIVKLPNANHQGNPSPLLTASSFPTIYLQPPVVFTPHPTYLPTYQVLRNSNISLFTSCTKVCGSA